MAVAQTKTELTADLLRLYLGDLERYAKDNLVIRTKKAQLVPLNISYFTAQQLVHARLAKQRKETGRVRAIVLKARQEGVSTYTAARFFRRIHLTPNVEGLVIADEKKRGQKLFEIYERFYRMLPDEIKPLTRYSAKASHLVFDVADPSLGTGLGSSISVETAKDAWAGRSSTLQLLHVSELGFWEKPEETWVSLMQAVPDEDSEIVVESTANGVGNFFHELWESSVQGESGFEPIFLPWWIHEEYRVPVTQREREEILATEDPFERNAMDYGLQLDGVFTKLAPEQIAWRRRAIRERFNNDERSFRQEYPATPDEAFLVSGNCFFDEDKLVDYRSSQKDPVFRANVISKDGGWAMVRAERGYLRVWERPMPGKYDGDQWVPGGFYVIFADTATGKQVAARDYGLSDARAERGGRDFSCADVYDVRKRKFVAQLHGRMAPEVFAKMLAGLGYLYSSEGPRGARGLGQPALIGVERNHASGETVLRILQDEMRYPNLFFHRMMNRRANRPTIFLGWITNAETRMPMLDELARAIREENISYWNPDGIREMFTFVRGEDGKPQAQEGAHDDRVISAAGCLQMARHARAIVVGTPPELKVANTPTGYG